MTDDKNKGKDSFSNFRESAITYRLDTFSILNFNYATADYSWTYHALENDTILANDNAAPWLDIF